MLQNLFSRSGDDAGPSTAAALISGARRRSSRQEGYKYRSIPSSEEARPADVDIPEEQPLEPQSPASHRDPWWQKPLTLFRQHKKLAIMVFSALGVSLFIFWTVTAAKPTHPSAPASCDTVEEGYTCQKNISQFWGQYSPYFAVPSDISPDIPKGCSLSFVQVLSRHGSRDPTASKTKLYNATVQQLQANVQNFTGKYAFLADYEYTLGADQLTLFGQDEMVNSGTQFFNRYADFSSKHVPFIRASGDDRVVESARNWTEGFHGAKIALKKADDTAYPYNVLVISEDAGQNNTLNHDTCTAFEDGFDSTIGDSAQATFMDTFVPAIQARLNADLPGANLSATQTIYMMDLCPFNTVASDTGAISPFCALFSVDEWHSYDYYETLGKYYGYGWGNPLGPSQGVGFTNELIARMTATAVRDDTSTNHTLDSSNVTFPVGGDNQLFADFSHDNNMIPIYSAIGLYNSTAPLSNTTIQTAAETNGFASSWLVPFGGRAYFEKMTCPGQPEELVRVLVNERVIPLETCGADALGRCTLSKFIDSLSYAQEGGNWDQCFV